MENLRDFEHQIIGYLITMQGREYIPLLSVNVFTHVDAKFVFSMLSNYYDEFKSLPSEIELKEYTRVETRQDNADILPEVYRLIHEAYKPWEGQDLAYVKSRIIEYAQQQETKRLFIEYSDKINEGLGVYQAIHKRMAEIIQIANPDAEEIIQPGGLLFRDGFPTQRRVEEKVQYEDTDTKLIPTMLEGLNRTMAAGGLRSPEFCLVMGAAKSFKTGFVINLAVGFARRGYKVYYADGENGLRSILNRIKQCITGTTLKEVFADEYENGSSIKGVSDVFANSIKLTRAVGGEIVVDSYSSGIATMVDVDRQLCGYRDRDNFVPDVIIFDAIEHFAPVRPDKSDWLNSQKVVMEAKNLNMKWGTVCISPAQVNRNALNKGNYGIQDSARDYGQIKYAHAVWSIVRMRDETQKHIALINTVVQREGLSQAIACAIRLDEARQQIREMTQEEMEELAED